MKTTLWLIRHAESEYKADQEEIRGLTEKGKTDAIEIGRQLQFEEIDVFISSPYQRAIATLLPAATYHQKNIEVIENLKERMMGNFEPDTFWEAKEKLYSNFEHAYPGGESSAAAQARAIREIEALLEKYQGKHVAIGTHGDIMTLILHHYSRDYDYSFWKAATMPDLYQALFDGNRLLQVTRKWDG